MASARSVARCASAGRCSVGGPGVEDAMFRTVLVMAIVSLAALLAALGSAAQAGPAAAPCEGVPWPAVDGLGRDLPLSNEVGLPRRDRFVGIFYFLWHDQVGGQKPGGGPYDVSQILAQDPNALEHPG